MKVVAALRNQFGGHADEGRRAGPPASPRREQPPRAARARHLSRVYVAAPLAHRLPVLAARPRSPLEPGVNVLVGRNGTGKTNLVEALGYLATLGSHRVATDAPLVRRGARRGPWCGPRWSPTTVSCCSSWRSTPGRANRARINRAPLTAAAGRPRRAAHGAVRARGPGPGPRRPGRTAPVPRRAADRARAPAAPASGPTTTGCSSSATRCSRPPVRAAARPRAATCAPWTSGTSTWPGRRRAGRRPAGPGRASCAPHVGRRVRRRWPAAAVAADGVVRSSSLGVGAAAGRAGVRSCWRRRCWPSWSGCAPDELERGISLVGPHRDDLELPLGGRPGEGLRQPRRVVVVRAGAAAGLVRAAARGRGRAGAGARRRVRRARHRPPRPAGRAGRRRRAGAGHRGRRRGRARPSCAGPATTSPTGRSAVSGEAGA